MSILDHSSYRVLPLEAEIINDANEIERRLQSGETVSYDDLEAIDDMRWDDIRRRNKVEEEPGEGYRLAK